MSNLRHSHTPSIRLDSIEPTDPEQKWRDAEALIEELRSLELLPLVLDIVEDVNSGRLLPKDVDNAAGTIRVRINKAREILRNVHGLSETPDERAARVERLTRNISSKQASLSKFRALVSKRLNLPEPEPHSEVTITESKTQTTNNETPASSIDVTDTSKPLDSAEVNAPMPPTTAVPSPQQSGESESAQLLDMNPSSPKQPENDIDGDITMS